MERKSPAKAHHPQEKPGVASQAPPATVKWEPKDVLVTARARMRQIVNESNARVQTMLAALLVEAGWTEKDFLDALVQDIASNGRERWQVPTPSLSPALPGSLERERGPATRPPPRKSGFTAKAGAGSYSHIERSKKAAR
jgi:hypothetical protein